MNNKEKNKAHDARMQERVRPKQPVYEFQELQAIINNWIRVK